MDIIDKLTLEKLGANTQVAIRPPPNETSIESLSRT